MAVVKSIPEVEPIKWTEGLAQGAVARDCRYKQHLLTIPNMHAFPYYECDLISITKSHFAHVFEIKVSRADFLSEFGEGRDAGFYKTKRMKEWGGDDLLMKGPNYFWLAAPADIFKPEEVPPWMGIMILEENRYMGSIANEVRRPKRLHREKSSPEFLHKIGCGLCIRYWQARAE